MYEIEHEMEMWAFGTGILGGHFFDDCKLSLCKHAISERRKQEKIERVLHKERYVTCKKILKKC